MDDRWFTDHTPSARWPHYTRANAGEVLPTPASPLGQTFVFDAAVLPGFQAGSCRMGFYEPADYRDGTPEMCGFFGGYFYNNLSCIRMQAVRNPAITVEQLDLAFFGERSDTPRYTAHPDDDKPHLRPSADAHMAFVVGAHEWPALLDEKAMAAQLRAARPDLTALDEVALVAHISALQPVIRDLAEHQLIAAGSSGIAPAMLAGVAAALGEPSLPVQVLAGLGDVDSAAPSFALWELSRSVRNSTELSACFDNGSEAVLSLLASPTAPDARDFARAFGDFLYEYGSRGPNEWELSAHTWETVPAIAIAALDRVRHQPDGRSPVQAARRVADARIAAVADTRRRLAEIGDDALTTTFEAALVAGNMMIYRERAKTTLIRVIHEVRVAVLELGRTLAARGDLAAPDQVFMLTAAELADVGRGVLVPGAVLAERAAAWRQLWTLAPPFFISGGAVPPLSTWPSRGGADVEPARPGETLVGVAGSAGIARGRARIVLDAAAPPDLRPGDVMVAPLTDPAWTPLFLAVEAVVVNVGGQISHAVIVSRELGLPCVVSVADATERIVDGALVEVDGTNGTVRVIAVD